LEGVIDRTRIVREAHFLDRQGNLVDKYKDSPLGGQLIDAKERLARTEVGEVLKTRVYNDLYTFFQRYYDNGDYVSKRRNRNGTYAIPYDGREVIFHWANRDQYYAKSGELLQDELLRIWHETTKTVVFITHSIDEAVYLSDRVVIFTPRPGTVKGEFHVDLPKPWYEHDVRTMHEFVSLRSKAWHMLKDSIIEAGGVDYAGE